MNSYKLFVIASASSVGLIYGYDMYLMKIIQLMDPFRIYFGLSTWDGSYRNEHGTVISELNPKDMPTYRNLDSTDNEAFIEHFISWSFIFGAIIGSVVFSYVSDKKSRKEALRYGLLVLIFGYLITYMSFHIIMINIGRLIVGIGMGCITTVCPIYIAEIAPATERCISSGCYYMMVGIGIIMSSLVNSFIWSFSNHVQQQNNELDTISKNMFRWNGYWRLSFMLQLLLCYLVFLFLFFIPNTPRWLSYNQFYSKALNIFTKIEGSPSDDLDNINNTIQEQYSAIQESSSYNRAIGQSSFATLFKRGNRRRTFSIISLHIFQQWTGVSIFHYYLHKLSYLPYIPKYFQVIFQPVLIIAMAFVGILACTEKAEKKSRKFIFLLATIILFLLNVIFIFFLKLSDPNPFFHINSIFETHSQCDTNHRNKTMYHDSSLNMNFYQNDCHPKIHYCDDDNKVISWDSTTLSLQSNYTYHIDRICDIRFPKSLVDNGEPYTFIFYIIFILFAVGAWYCIPWIYKAEVFPIRLRAKGSAIGSVTQFLNNGLVISIMPFLIKSWGSFVFIILIINNMIAIVITMIYSIETKGQTLEDIEANLEKKDLQV